MSPVDLGPLLAPIFHEAKIPGGAALILRGNDVFAAGVAGVRKRGAAEKIELGDRFHLGSCSKAMTATVAARLIDQGKLSWSTNLGTIFSGRVKKMHHDWSDVAIETVLAHKAGLPRNPGWFDSLRSAFSKQPIEQQRIRVVGNILCDAPRSKPGTRFDYSNVGFILAGAALESVTGHEWEELMREHIFEPLGITSGGFGPPGMKNKSDQPKGHRGSGRRPVEPGLTADNPAIFGPSGRVHMTIGDWSKFVALHLRGNPSNPERHVTLLSDAAFARLHRPGPDGDYVAGWATGTRSWAKGKRPTDTGTILHHSGSNGLWFAVVWIAPEIDLAVLVVCNAGGVGADQACDKVAGELIRSFGDRLSTMKK